MKTHQGALKTSRLPAPLSQSPELFVRLRELMLIHHTSFEKLAAYSGLGLKELSAIESGKIKPSLQTLWKIANALGVPFGTLLSNDSTAIKRWGEIIVLRESEKAVIASSNGAFVTRPLFPFDLDNHVEFYELTIATGHLENSEAHAAGTRESLVVVHGQIEIISGKALPQRLNRGDAIIFEGDVPHSYQNFGPTDTVLHLAISYAD
jgi:transcriptional regulator with XRE-family HTH domain